MEPKSKWSKKNEIAALLVSFALSLTALFFPAAETFLQNPIEFHIPATVALLPLLGVALGIGLGCWLLLNLLLLLHEKLFRAVMLLLYGMLLASYIQLLFYNGRLTVLNGTQTSSFNFADTYMKTNWFVMVGIIVLPMLFFLLQQVRPAIPKIDKIKWKSVPFICGTILVMQLAGLLPALFRYINAIESDNKPTIRYMSYEPLLSLSKKNNIIVFLTDRLDGTMVDDLLEYYPEVADTLDGFTFYRNNVSCYTNTFPSVPNMLTGTDYQGEEWLKYINKIWADDNVMRRLHDAGYQVNLILDGNSTFYKTDQLETFTDNLRDAAFSYNLGDQGIILSEMSLSLYRVLPYVLKELPFTAFSLSLGNYIQVDESIKDYYSADLSCQTDISFYRYLQENKLNADCSKPTFSFIHLNAAHNPNPDLIALCGRDQINTTEVLTDNYNGVDVIQTLRCSIDIIEMYMDQMKQLGIYDNTTIIIIGDHGRSMTVKEEYANEVLADAITTGLLIKPANAPHGALLTDRETEMTNSYFSASILEYAGLDHAELGLSFQDAVATQPHTERFLTMYRFRGFLGTPAYINSYIITGDARDFSNWKLRNSQ